MLRFGCQLQMCSKRLKVFTLVMQEMRKKGSVCNVTDVSAWKHMNFKAYYTGRYSKHRGHTEYSESLLDQYYKHYAHMCSCKATGIPNKSRESLTLQRKFVYIGLLWYQWRRQRMKETSLLKACIQSQKLEIWQTCTCTSQDSTQRVDNVRLTQKIRRLFARLSFLIFDL